MILATNPIMYAFFYALYMIINIYFYMIIAYILLSWVPELRKTKFYTMIYLIVSPYMRFFRGILVFGNFDFTPIVGIMLLRFFLLFMNDFLATL